MRTCKLLIALLAMVMITANMAFAGNTQKLSVSCTIPLVPGLNAPITEETTVVPNETIEELYEYTMLASETELEKIQEETISEDLTLYTFCLK